MKRKNFVLCGGIIWNGEIQEIMCDPEVGELCFEDELCGAVLVGELSVVDPIAIPDIRNLAQLLKEGNLMGTVYTKHGVYAILNENVAELRPLGKVLEPTGNTIPIDLDIEACIEDDD